MQSEALLILPLSLLSSLTSPSPSHLAALREATANTSSHLTVLVRTPFFDYSSPQHLCPRTHWNEIQSYLSVIYGESTRVAQRKGRMLFKVDVILEGFGGKEGEEKRWEGIEGCPWHVIYMDQDERLSTLPKGFPRTPRNVQIVSTQESASSDDASQQPSTSNSTSTYPVVALGGSFDHLHAGHKILLTMATLIASRKLIVGVSDDALLKNKAHADQLESLSTRKSLLRAFLTRLNPALEYDICTINDVYGPTATEKDIQALVLSQETVAGGEAISKLRQERSLPPLETHVISVISHLEQAAPLVDADRIKEAKLSSTFIRGWLAEQPQGEGPAE